MDEAWTACELEDCRGVRIEDFDRCLDHLEPARQDEYFAGLSLGAEVDLRGTELSRTLVERLVDAVGSIDGRRAEFGRAEFAGTIFREFADFGGVTFFDGNFEGAGFEDGVNFGKADFRGIASFLGSRFEGRATFESVIFEEITFEGANFAGETRFDRATFKGGDFTNTRFDGRVSFEKVKFEGDVSFSQGFPDDVSFDEAEFAGEAGFGLVRFDGRSTFVKAKFAAAATFGGATFDDYAWFDDARFDGEATFENVRFSSEVSFEGAVFTVAERFGPVTAGRLIFGRATFRRRMLIDAGSPVVDCTHTRFEEGVTLSLGRYSSADLARTIFGKASTVIGASVASVGGTDVADLVFTDVGLVDCRFAGAHHLDKLRLEGDCRFGTDRKRQMLAEERAWRADRDAPVGPRRIGDLYRQLRKAQEDSKNEPGAADFYYGEMEMRRHSKATPWSERVILHLYWLVSGYGLRALRALATFAVLVAVVTVAFTAAGFKGSAAFGDTLIYVAQSTVSLETKLTSLPKELTPFGEVMRLVMRVLGPLLLGLALLAVRNRVKR
ncbi:pentapeptide repeat-containing protein [Amycolatopsis sp. NPDC051071]|uniref:pentapeptide repeat-containing protein n=1 Tax=Amycolatopsis sp. NPDC051071 TaxID=3154637 RepID=UPI00341303CF